MKKRTGTEALKFLSFFSVITVSDRFNLVEQVRFHNASHQCSSHIYLHI